MAHIANSTKYDPFEDYEKPKRFMNVPTLEIIGSPDSPDFIGGEVVPTCPDNYRGVNPSYPSGDCTIIPE